MWTFNYDIYNIGITCATLALGCAGIFYLVVKKIIESGRDKKAVDALNYLKIEVVTTEDHCDAVTAELRRQCGRRQALGFDCEWVTEEGKRQPVALVQLSSYDGYCALFRLSHMKCIPESLKSILEDERIFKVGVAPKDDAKYLALDYSVVLQGTLDIRHIARLCGHESGGLAALSAAELGIVLDKSWRVRCSDWAAPELSDRQVKYAAADAHVAVKMFLKLLNEFCKSGALSWLSSHENKVSWKQMKVLCSKYADIAYNSKGTIKKSELGKSKSESTYKGKDRYVTLTRSKPLYYNCFLEAPDGELLCTCDTKKAHWYVMKQLADVVKESPLTVRLRFEPAGRSVGDVGLYYQLTKENRCVVCGGHNSYIRKNVVPREYRRYFPELMKDHSSHDVVLLCVQCHKRSNRADQAVRERLARACAAPLPAADHARCSEDADNKKIRSAARALLYQPRKHVLPEARLQQLQALVRQLHPLASELTREQLEDAANLQVVFENTDYTSHGSKVVEYYLQHQGLLQLERLWREHFLATMKPKWMPELWSTRHNEERMLVRLSEGRLSEEEVKLLGLDKITNKNKEDAVKSISHTDLKEKDD